MKKTKIALILISALLILWILFWFLRPLTGMKLYYWSYETEEMFTLDSYRMMYDSHPEEYQLIRNELSFPSQDISDYCTVVLGAEAWNISPFTASRIEITVDWNNPESDVILVSPSTVSSVYCRRFSKLETRYLTSFLVYRNGKTDQEIVDSLKDAEVIVTYNTAFRAYAVRRKLGHFPHRVMDSFDEWPRGWNVPVEEIPEGVEIIE